MAEFAYNIIKNVSHGHTRLSLIADFTPKFHLKRISLDPT